MKEIKLVKNILLKEEWDVKTGWDIPDQPVSNEVFDMLSQDFLRKYYDRKIGDDYKNLEPSLKSKAINWNNVKSLDWEELIKSAKTMVEYDTLMELFFTKWCIKSGNNVYPKAYENAKDVILHSIRELGVDETSNPLLPFIRNYYNINKDNPNLNKNQLATPYNGFAKGYLDRQDLSGNGPSGTDHIIFNPNLYKIKLFEDQDELVKIYEKLSDEVYMKRFDVNKVWKEWGNTKENNNSKGGSTYRDRIKSNSNIVQDIQNIKDLKDPSKIRDYIIFEGGNPRGKIRDINTIKNLIFSGENSSKFNYEDEDEDNKTNGTKKETKYQRASKAETYLKNLEKNIKSYIKPEDLIKVIDNLKQSGYFGNDQ